MQFKIEYGETEFLVVAPGDKPGLSVSYCDVATVEHEGRVYAAFLNGDENEVDPGPTASNILDPSQPRAKVYDITDWPTITPVETITENVIIEGEDEDDEDEEEDAEPEPGVKW